MICILHKYREVESMFTSSVCLYINPEIEHIKRNNACYTEELKEVG